MGRDHALFSLWKMPTALWEQLQIRTAIVLLNHTVGAEITPVTDDTVYTSGIPEVEN